MYALNSASNRGRMLRKLWKCCKSSFWRANNRNNTNFLGGSSKLQSGKTSSEHAECSGLPSMSKTDQKHYIKKHPKNRRIITISEAVDMLGISSGSVQSIWKKIWTGTDCTNCRLFQIQCTCSLCPVCVCQFLVLQTVIPQFTRFSTCSFSNNALHNMLQMVVQSSATLYKFPETYCETDKIDWK